MSKVEEIVGMIEGMTVLELSELSKSLQDKFGVSAAVPMAAGGGGGAAAPAVEEKTEFAVVLTGAGDKKIQVIKVVRELTGLGLAEAKALVDGVPKTVKEGISRDEAEQIKNKLAEAGAAVDVK
ncbi:MAG: 50S ribosomal protein L7/L12 [candidate division Zixibacteria bacterium]|nr:50S ribosomal protein L7/L12 [candidate division Zixibacteria bacterium]MCI0597148.1 50S ribosomal protein L7/L12 [candidate division Zixibacteria bacterium]